MEVKSVMYIKQTVCLHFEMLYFLKYDVLSEYLTLFWFSMLLTEYEIEFMFRKIRNIRNLGNFHIRGPRIYEQNRCAESSHDLENSAKVSKLLLFSCDIYHKILKLKLQRGLSYMFCTLYIFILRVSSTLLKVSSQHNSSCFN